MGYARCTACDKTIKDLAVGRSGHESSKLHKQNAAEGFRWETVDKPVDGNAEVANLGSTGAHPRIAELEAQLDEAEARAVRAEQRARDNASTAEWHFYDSEEDILADLGADFLNDIAENNLATENKKRQRQGKPPLYSDLAAGYERAVKNQVDGAVKKLARRQILPDALDPEQHLRMRGAKMVKPGQDADGNPSFRRQDGAILWQLPLEEQINNGAGSLNDPVTRYTNKGSKLAVDAASGLPMCALWDCYGPAAYTTAGAPTHGGYCSAAHRMFVEGDRQQSRAGEDMLVRSGTGAMTRGA